MQRRVMEAISRLGNAPALRLAPSMAPQILMRVGPAPSHGRAALFERAVVQAETRE